jgi:hypothetical protein
MSEFSTSTSEPSAPKESKVSDYIQPSNAGTYGNRAKQRAGIFTNLDEQEGKSGVPEPENNSETWVNHQPRKMRRHRPV